MAGTRSVDYLGAKDTLELVAGSEFCDPAAQHEARAAEAEIDEISQAEQRQQQEQAARRRADETRIQENGMRLLNEGSQTTLTQEEREEVFRNAVNTMHLHDPPTPEEERLVRRMYEAMVLGTQRPSANSLQNGQ